MFAALSRFRGCSNSPGVPFTVAAKLLCVAIHYLQPIAIMWNADTVATAGRLRKVAGHNNGIVAICGMSQEGEDA